MDGQDIMYQQISESRGTDQIQAAKAWEKKAKGKEIEEFLNLEFLKHNVQVILQISKQAASLCREKYAPFSSGVVHIYIFGKSGKADSDLICYLQMLLIWQEKENLATEYFMAGMRTNSVFTYTDNTTQ